MKTPTPPTPEEFQAKLAELRHTAIDVLRERAKTDPKMVAQLRKRGISPDA